MVPVLDGFLGALEVIEEIKSPYGDRSLVGQGDSFNTIPLSTG